MTKHEFEIEMKVLFDTFGTSEYPPARVMQIWEIVKDLDAKAFRSIVKNLCYTCSVKYPPLPARFIEDSNIKRTAKVDYYSEKLVADERGPEKFQEIMAKLGATNVIDAMEKFKKQGAR